MDNNEAPVIKTTEEVSIKPVCATVKERRILVPIDIASHQHSKISTEFVLKHSIKPKERSERVLEHFVTERLALQSS
jgi:hypothetical protein